MKDYRTARHLFRCSAETTTALQQQLRFEISKNSIYVKYFRWQQNWILTLTCTPVPWWMCEIVEFLCCISMIYTLSLPFWLYLLIASARAWSLCLPASLEINNITGGRQQTIKKLAASARMAEKYYHNLNLIYAIMYNNDFRLRCMTQQEDFR